MPRYKIRIDKLYKEYPYDVYLMDSKTGRSGVVSSWKTRKQALKAKKELLEELRKGDRI